MDGAPRNGTKGGKRRSAGSEGIKKLGLWPPDQVLAYSGGGAEKVWVDIGGVVDGWESGDELPSGGGLPKIAERMEYSRFAASDPKGKDGVSKGILNRGSVGAKPFIAVYNKVVRREMRER
jgi:hypothetical protein